MASIPPRRVKSIRPVAPPEERDRTVLRWAKAIDAVDYLTMLRLPRTPTGPSESEVRRAYRAFARAFHPDNYTGASAEVREAAAKVFSAGADAHHVLSDPLLRLRYMRALAEGKIRVPLEDLERATEADRAQAARKPAAALAKTTAGRASAERADKMIALGELSYAKAALEEAVRKEPDNVALAAKLQAVEARLYAPRGGKG